MSKKMSSKKEMNMANDVLSNESREVQSFNWISLKGYGVLVIEQGETETLSIETHPDLLPKITSEVVQGRLNLGQGGSLLEKIGFSLETSLTRKPIRYRVTVRELKGLEVYGAARVIVRGITTPSLFLKSNGPSHISFDSLEADALEVELPVGGAIDMQGEVKDQRVVVSGPGSYRAARLKSKNARAKITGPGSAILWAIDNLEVDIRGIGTVKYYGSPTVKKKIAGFGGLSALGHPIG
jgi:hypothetical protein